MTYKVDEHCWSSSVVVDDFRKKNTFALNFLHDTLNLYLFLFIHHIILIVLLAQRLLFLLKAHSDLVSLRPLQQSDDKTFQPRGSLYYHFCPTVF